MSETQLNIMLASAITTAAVAFAEKLDKGGQPYILHCLKVMHNLQTKDQELQCIAVLHDIVEDTSTTYQQLVELGFTQRVIDGIRRMTKLPGDSPEDYFNRVASSQDSIRVKLADLRHNSDIRRLKGITDQDFARVRKYQEMYTRLQALL